MKIITLLLVLLFISSCSKKEKKTKTQITNKVFVVKSDFVKADLIQEKNEKFDLLKFLIECKNNDEPILDSIAEEVFLVKPFEVSHFDYRINEVFKSVDSIYLINYNASGYGCDYLYSKLYDFNFKKTLDFIKLGETCDGDSPNDTITIPKILVKKDTIFINNIYYLDGNELFVKKRKFVFGLKGFVEQ